ncbi:glycine dehydrogenase [Bizionia gelidisalsuginis]|uniref:Glycine dehydrogenase n=2 Tax=Bizionia TaxID=283785 RepID=A0A8H2LDW0_9FLAO|nr:MULTISPECIES: glycine dehydrogenase [Bizionia]TYB73903.1 glycine dehydrogenase [Bizionia saleffrena]TYC12866.1 glycine dehydrogenase [Bizionia gelidisalsuginis]
MTKKNSLFMPCTAANVVCDKAQYNEATLWEKVQMYIHLVMCKLCRKYTKNNLKLTKLIDANRNEKFQRLDHHSKAQLKITFDKELAKHHNE